MCKAFQAAVGAPLLKAFGMCSGNRGQGASALERQVLQQYLSARQLRDMAAEQRGDLSITSPNESARPDSRAGADLVNGLQLHGASAYLLF